MNGFELLQWLQELPLEALADSKVILENKTESNELVTAKFKRPLPNDADQYTNKIYLIYK